VPVVARAIDDGTFRAYQIRVAISNREAVYRKPLRNPDLVDPSFLGSSFFCISLSHRTAFLRPLFILHMHLPALCPHLGHLPHLPLHLPALCLLDVLQVVDVRFQLLHELLHALYALVASGYCLVIQRDLMRDLIRRCHQYLGA
jgi:hypothetical protein